MFIDRAHRAELEMLIPAQPTFTLPGPWPWVAAVAWLLLMFAVAAL